MKLQIIPGLAIALLAGLASAPQAWAGRGGGHWGGGFHGSGFHGGGFHRGGHFGGSGFHHGFRGGPGFHHGGRFGPGFGAPVFFAGGASYPYYYASAPFVYPPSPYDPWFNYQMGYTPYPPNYRTNYWASATLGPTCPPPQPVAEYTAPVCPGLVAGDVVGNVQRVLRYRGFYRGPIDGLSSPTTRAAIQAYDLSVGLPPTGAIDARLLKSMGLM